MPLYQGSGEVLKGSGQKDRTWLAVWMKKGSSGQSGFGSQSGADAPVGWPGLVTVEGGIHVMGIEMLKTESGFSNELAGEGDKGQRQR